MRRHLAQSLGHSLCSTSSNGYDGDDNRSSHTMVTVYIVIVIVISIRLVPVPKATTTTAH